MNTMINVHRTSRHHFRSYLLVVLVAVLALRFPSVRAVTPAGCHLSGAILTCPLKLGINEFTLDGTTTATALALVNTGRALQVNQVIGQSLSKVTGTFGEFCVYLDRFETAQSSPGEGEVGCFPKKSSERYFGSLEWGTSTALAVPAGSTLYLQGYVLPVPGSSGHDFPFQFNVTTYPQSRGVLSYRQPKIDAAIYCNGSPSTSAGSPWPNDTGRTLTILGATIYALDPPPDAACLYILDTAGAVKWKNCNLTPHNQRGVAMLPTPVTVLPGEQILAQASHTCAAPGVWDWAAYIYTY